ncbi:MAG: hypothetical protein ISS82_00860 [Nanoarchaeota archaeon]|nr:hypothetical protein [Nanoarchaeota archaeon]
MQYMYHFTSKENWKKIQTSGKLIPKTTIEWVYESKDFTERTKSICPQRKYTVGFPEPCHKGWVEYGVWDEIFRLIKAEVILKIKLPENSKGFVREHVSITPKRMKEKYGEDVYFQAYSGKIPVRDPKIKESLVKYYNSAVPLAKYKGNFIVPEIWIPEEIPLENIEQIPFLR